MTTLLVMAMMWGAVSPQKFYPDDPIPREPASISLEDAAYRKLNDFYDLFLHTFGDPGEQGPEGGEPIRAQSTNTVDEVPDNAWFTNRIGSVPMSVEDVARGPRTGNAPDPGGPWTIVGAKTEGVTPGFQIEDSRGSRYLLKFDPETNPEMATGAGVIGALIFHALGYNVPEDYLVTFDPEILEIAPGAMAPDHLGVDRPISRIDVNTALARVPRLPDGRLRGIASRYLSGRILGEFRYHGTRSDDPNDIVPHEHRRELRGLFVFAAWVNHNDSRPINTLDSLVEDGGLSFIRHYLIDFGATLGSASVLSNSARDGNAYFFEFKQALAQAISLGLYTPGWARARYDKSDAIGMINHDAFDPDAWKPNYPNPAFRNRLPDDEFWAAKKVMAFTDEQIGAIVGEARYSDPADEAALVEYLIQRRHRIGQTYFERVLPLDRFRVEEDRLVFDDLGVLHGISAARNYPVRWSRFDNSTEEHVPFPDASGPRLPEQVTSSAPGSYFLATVGDEGAAKSVLVYVRRDADGVRIVGVERTW